MPNPYGTLAGISDPEQPGWQDRLMDKVRQSRAGSMKHRATSRVTLDMDYEFRELLIQACKTREISLSGYIRRAVGAFVAHDLGMDPVDVYRHCRRPGPYGEHGPKKRPADDGTGHGDWSIR